MRGEHAAKNAGELCPLGSSPHAWGTHMRHRSQLLQGRFIPTCVGNTAAVLRSATIIAVHPHMRGEHPILDYLDLAHAGSSPHAWGTPLPLATCLVHSRFIPTCVGNTISIVVSLKGNTVHPHMRGEH